jgi:glucan-binding YG repeat protein
MKHQIEFEPALSNFLDESFSNGSGDKPKKASKPKTVKPKSSSRTDDTYVGRSRAESGSRDIGDGSSGGSSKSKLTAEQIQQGVDIATQVGGAISQLPKNQAKQDLQTACGKKPLLKKNRATWDKCAVEYAKNKNQPTESQSQQTQSTNETPTDTDEKKFYQNPLFIGGVVLVVAVGGFFAYKYFKKTPVAVPSV